MRMDEHDSKECLECRHDYVRGYGYAYDEGCGNCMGYGWTPEVIHAVALAARDEAQLEELQMLLAHKEISHRAVREPDAPWNGQLMAIGIEPVKDRTKLRKILRRFPLLREGISTGREPGRMSPESGGSSPPPRPIHRGSSTSRATRSTLVGGGASPSPGSTGGPDGGAVLEETRGRVGRGEDFGGSRPLPPANTLGDRNG